MVLLYRIFFLSFLILGVLVFEHNIWAEEQIRYNIEGEAAAFKSENNSAKIRITIDNAFLRPHLETPEPFTISLESDEKLKISQFTYGDAIGGTTETTKAPVPIEGVPPLNIVTIWTHTELENTKSFSDVQNITITTDKLLINPVHEVTASIYSDTISVDNARNLAFPDAKMFSISIPKGTTEYYIALSEDAEVMINGTKYVPEGGWKDKAAIITLDSVGLRSLTTTGNFFIISQWLDLEIDSQDKFDFLFYDIGEGELSIDEPKEWSTSLSRTDDIFIRDIQGEVSINKVENSFQISSRGTANSIVYNEENILIDDSSFWDFIYDPTVQALAAILTIATIVISRIKAIVPKIKDWNRHRKNDKFFESGEAAKVEDQMADYLDGKYDK